MSRLSFVKMSDFDFTKVDWFVVGISGGKDSTGLLRWMKKEFLPSRNISPDKLLCIFTDTQNEAPETYNHILKISQEIHPVICLESEGFYNLARRKKRFPSTKARFCTTELKLIPAKNFMDSLEGKILSVNGVRADESRERAELPEFSEVFDSHSGYTTWRPLLDWTLEDVFLIHKRYNFPLNPLYEKGFKRVGCMPCIMSRKSEIRLMAKLMPERIEQLSEAENSFEGRSSFHSFFARNAIPLRYRTHEYETKKGEKVLIGTIKDVTEWSRTSDFKRSSNFDFHYEDFEDAFEESSCMAGVCE